MSAPYLALTSTLSAAARERKPAVSFSTLADGTTLAHIDLFGDAGARVITWDSDWCRKASAVLLAAAQGLEAAQGARAAVAAQLAPDAERQQEGD